MKISTFGPQSTPELAHTGTTTASRPSVDVSRPGGTEAGRGRELQSVTVGDHLVVPVHGVARVVSVGPREGLEMAGICCGLVALSDDTRLFVPLARLARSGLRVLATRSEVDSAFSTLRDPSPPKRSPGYKWHQELTKKASSGGLLLMAEVLRDLSHLKSQRSLSATERHILDGVLEHVTAEIVLVTGRARRRVEQEIETAVRYRDPTRK